MRNWRSCLVLFTIIFPAMELAAVADDAATNRAQVSVLRFEWQDASRNRKVPVKIYYPANISRPLPVIVFSHGLGGSREGYEYLGNYWASHGYVSVHLQHLGSDSGVWQNVEPSERMAALRRAAADPQNAANRPLDVTFALDQLAKLNGDPSSPLRDRLDLERIGTAGHSFGAYTALAVAGELFERGGVQVEHRDPRIKAAIAMSSPAPHLKDYDRAFSKIAIPVFHMTGTADDSPIGETKATERLIPFEHTKAPDQFLLIFKGGDHMVFSGRPHAWGNDENDAKFQNLVCVCSTKFWDAYLKDDAAAKSWLKQGGAEKLLKDNAKFEIK